MYHPDFLSVAYNLLEINPSEYKKLHKTRKGDHRKILQNTVDLSSRFNEQNGNAKNAMRRASRASVGAKETVNFPELPADIEREAKHCFRSALNVALLLLSVKLKVPAKFLFYCQSE